MTLSQAFLLTVKKQKECRAAAAGSSTLIALCVGVFALFLAALKIFDLGSGVAPVLLILFFCLLFWLSSKAVDIDRAQNEYNEFYKEVFIPALIKDIDESFTYSAYGGISQSEFDEAGIYRPSTFYSEDSVRGVYKGVKFSLCEVISHEREYPQINNKYVAIFILLKYAFDKYSDFKGSVLKCEFNKKFNGKTVAVSKDFNTKFLGEKELLDDVKFNENFRVFTTDKVEARYLLTPAFMGKLNMIKAYKNTLKSPSAAFMDNKFYLFCFSRRNFFEGRLFDKLDIAKARREQRYVRQMLSVIDELNLSLDIYLK